MATPVAQHLLAVPAASTSSERLFSLAVLTLSDRRSNLSGDSVDGLLFIHELKQCCIETESLLRMDCVILIYIDYVLLQ